MRDLMTREELNVELSEKVQAAVMAYILTATKFREPSVFVEEDGVFQLTYEETTLGQNSLDKIKKVTPSVAKELDRRLRVKLAEFSVKYIQHEALSCAVDLQAAANAVKCDLGRQVAPTYVTMEVIIERMRQLKIPLIINVSRYERETKKLIDRVSIGFNCAEKKCRAAMVIEGFNIRAKESPEDLLKRVRNVGIKTILLGHAAALMSTDLRKSTAEAAQTVFGEGGAKFFAFVLVVSMLCSYITKRASFFGNTLAALCGSLSGLAIHTFELKMTTIPLLDAFLITSLMTLILSNNLEEYEADYS